MRKVRRAMSHTTSTEFCVPKKVKIGDLSSAEESNEMKQEEYISFRINKNTLALASDGSTTSTAADTINSLNLPIDRNSLSHDVHENPSSENYHPNLPSFSCSKILVSNDDERYRNSSESGPYPNILKNQRLEPSVKILLIFQNHTRNDFKQFHVSVTTEMRRCFDRYCSLTKQSSSSLLFFAARKDGKRNLHHHISGTQTAQSLNLQHLDVITAYPKYFNLKFAHDGGSSDFNSSSAIFRLRVSCTMTIQDAFESYAHCIQSSLHSLQFSVYRSEQDESALSIQHCDTPVSLYLPDDHIILVRSTNLSPTKKKEHHHKSLRENRSCYHFGLLVFLAIVIAVLVINLLDTQSKLQDKITNLNTDLKNKEELIISLRQSNLTCYNELSAATAKLGEIYEDLHKKKKKSGDHANSSSSSSSSTSSSSEKQKQKSNSKASFFQSNVWKTFNNIFSNNPFQRRSSNDSDTTKRKVPKCKYVSENKVIEALKQDPLWSQLVLTDYRSDTKRRKLCRDLARKFHPDKMMQLGCPSDYGTRVMYELNVFRCFR